jgi:hypothetical protein
VAKPRDITTTTKTKTKTHLHELLYKSALEKALAAFLHSAFFLNLERALRTTKYTNHTNCQRFGATKTLTAWASRVPLASRSFFVCLVYFVV